MVLGVVVVMVVLAEVVVVVLAEVVVVVVVVRLGSPAHIHFSNTFLSSFDTFLREPITKLAFPPGALLAGLTQ